MIITSINCSKGIQINQYSIRLRTYFMPIWDNNALKVCGYLLFWYL